MFIVTLVLIFGIFFFRKLSIPSNEQPNPSLPENHTLQGHFINHEAGPICHSDEYSCLPLELSHSQDEPDSGETKKNSTGEEPSSFNFSKVRLSLNAYD